MVDDIMNNLATIGCDQFKSADFACALPLQSGL